MSGICAVMGPNPEPVIKTLCKSLMHRGPDAEGFFIDGKVALGYTGLRTDFPLPQQPLANEDRTIWIAFDGEIYNKGQLIDQLERNHTFRTKCSAEIMVHAYEENWPNFASEINGSFAFCLWDSTKKQLFSAKDRIGVKPLYYYRCADLFILASEIKALLTVPSVPRKPNEHVIHDYLVNGHNLHPAETFFMGIESLLPAHFMTVQQNEIKILKYWNSTKPSISHPPRKDDQYYASEFRELLRDSVRIRLPTNLSVGTYLSGGLDSASIACLLNDILKSEIPTGPFHERHQKLFSAIYRLPGPQGDERPYIKEVTRALTTDTNYIFPSVVGRWNDIRTFIYFLDEPVSVFNYYVFWCLSRAAVEKVKVVFYGITGGFLTADTVSHYRKYFKELWRRKKIARLMIELVGALPRMSMSSLAEIPAVFGHSIELKVSRLLAPEFVSRFPSDEQEEEASSLLDHLRVCDRSSAAFLIEPRYPFLDHRIVEFSLSLPETQRIRNGWTKYVLRNAMKDLIPESIRKTRKKFGTPVPLERWMKELRGNIRGILQSRRLGERGYFNQVAILDMFDRLCEGRLTRSERQHIVDMLWRILNLELWFEIFFDSTDKGDWTELSANTEGKSKSQKTLSQ